ncbi:LRR domain containing protein [Parasponia andersonii]|uniref:LRR domain containing protein n=1 Tax=Parasponia andersonii TaxID=3476 RepID=A0A2P5A8J5_PARAD|nr:LRR domain containing protein [Parasponia andersonii]
MKLPLLEKVGVIPSVCKSWRRVTNTCLDFWVELDFERLSDNMKSETFKRLLRMLLQRDSGRLHTFRSVGLPNDYSLSIIVEHNIGGAALGSIGYHCKNLTRLDRNLHIWDPKRKSSTNEEAFAIAATMPTLKHLEIAYLNVSTEGVFKILSGCPLLEFLDIRKWYIYIQDYELFSNKFPALKVLGLLKYRRNFTKRWEWDDRLNLGRPDTDFLDYYIG